MRRIGIIETGTLRGELRERFWNYPSMFVNLFSEQRDFAFYVYGVGKAMLPTQANECDAWIITGSSAGVYDKRPWIPQVKSFVNETMQRRIPTLGICFGHQLMAEALGGKAEKSDRGRGIGLHQYALTHAGRILVPDASTINLFAAHQDQVVEAPPGAEVLATSEFCPIAALRYGKYGLSIQPHPEFSRDFERELIVDWQNKSPMPEQLYRAAMETLKTRKPDSISLVPALSKFLTGSLEL